jgi:hypothetical protein
MSFIFFYRSPRARCLCYATSPQSSRLSSPTLTLTPALSPHLLLGGPGGVACACSCGQVFVHTYIHTYIHTYVYAYIRSYTQINACIHKDMYIYIYICMYVYVCIYVYTHTCRYVYGLLYIYVYNICVYIPIYNI